MTRNRKVYLHMQDFYVCDLTGGQFYDFKSFAFENYRSEESKYDLQHHLSPGLSFIIFQMQPPMTHAVDFNLSSWRFWYWSCELLIRGRSILEAIVRSRRRENTRPLSLSTFACSTLWRRSYAGHAYDHSERWNHITNLDVLTAMYRDETECITSIYFYYIDIRPTQANAYLKFWLYWLFNPRQWSEAGGGGG